MRVIRVMRPPVDRVDHLPDGSAGVCYIRFADGSAKLVAIGPYTRALYTRPAPFEVAVHVGFAPGSAYRYFQIPLEALADRAVPLRELWGREADRLLEALHAAPDPAVLLEATLAARRDDDAASAAIVRAAATHLARASAPIRDLARDLQISERSLRRAFTTAVGVAPKIYARIARFRRALPLLASARGHWAEVARAAGYADQAHLANELRALARVAPSRLVTVEGRDHLRTACPIVG